MGVEALSNRLQKYQDLSTALSTLDVSIQDGDGNPPYYINLESEPEKQQEVGRLITKRRSRIPQSLDRIEERMNNITSTIGQIQSQEEKFQQEWEQPYKEGIVTPKLFTRMRTTQDEINNRIQMENGLFYKVSQKRESQSPIVQQQQETKDKSYIDSIVASFELETNTLSFKNGAVSVGKSAHLFYYLLQHVGEELSFRDIGEVVYGDRTTINKRRVTVLKRGPTFQEFLTIYNFQLVATQVVLNGKETREQTIKLEMF